MAGNFRRMASLPTWETLSEPKVTDDEEEDYVDELSVTSASANVSARSSPRYAEHTPAAASSSVRNTAIPPPTSDIRRPPSTQPTSASTTSTKLGAVGASNAMPPPSQLPSERPRSTFPLTQLSGSSKSVQSPSASTSQRAGPSFVESTHKTGQKSPFTSPIKSSVGSSARTQSSPTRPLPASPPPARSKVASAASSSSGLTQPSRKPSSSISSSSKGKVKESPVVNLDRLDDVAASDFLTQVSAKTKNIKKSELTTSPEKSPVKPSSHQKKKSFIKPTSSSSEDEGFPSLESLSQAFRRSSNSSSSTSPKRISVSSPLDTPSRREEIENSDDEPEPSISQVPRRPTKPLSSSKPKPAPFSMTQPASTDSTKPGLSSAPFSILSRSSILVESQQRPTSTKTSATNLSTSKIHGAKPFYDAVIELSDSDEEQSVRKTKSNKGVNRPVKIFESDGIIDLTMDEEDNPLPSVTAMPTTQPARVDTAKRSSFSIQPGAGPFTQPMKSTSSNVGPNTPPAVRPKPRHSAVPKEKLAVKKPQPAESRPLDVSRRRSDPSSPNVDSAGIPSGLSKQKPSSATSSKAKKIVTSSHLTGMETEQKSTSDTREDRSPTFLPSRSASAVVSSGVEQAHEATLIEPVSDLNVDDSGHMMDTGDFDAPMERAPSPDKVMDVTMQPVETNPSSEQAASVNDGAEETSEPIERARELRSPSASTQVQETQTQARDVDEVELILGPTISQTQAAEISPNPSKRTQEPKSLEQVPTSPLSENGGEQRPRTLTDKLEMLDLSLSATVDKGGRRSDLDVLMGDSTVITRPPDTASNPATGDEPGFTVGDTAVDQTEVGQPQPSLNDVASSSATITLSPSSKFSTARVSTSSSPTVSEKQAKFIRDVSPGAIYAPEPQGNFMGFFGPKKSTPSPVKHKDKPAGTVVSAKGKGGSEEEVANLVGDTDSSKASGGERVDMKPLRPNVQVYSPKASSSTAESMNSAKLSAAIAKTTEQQIRTSGTKSRSATPLSPRLQTILSAPDERSSRGSNVLPHTPLADLRASASAETITGVAPRMESTSSRSNHLPSRKELEQNGLPRSSQSDSIAMVTARALKTAFSFSDATSSNKAASPNGTSSAGNVSGDASTSRRVIKPASMPYVQKRILEHKMQSPDSVSSDTSRYDSLAPAYPKASKSTQLTTGNSSETWGTQRMASSTSIAATLADTAEAQESAEVLGASDSSNSVSDEEFIERVHPSWHKPHGGRLIYKSSGGKARRRKSADGQAPRLELSGGKGPSRKSFSRKQLPRKSTGGQAPRLEPSGGKAPSCKSFIRKQLSRKSTGGQAPRREPSGRKQLPRKSSGGKALPRKSTGGLAPRKYSIIEIQSNATLTMSEPSFLSYGKFRKRATSSSSSSSTSNDYGSSDIRSPRSRAKRPRIGYFMPEEGSLAGEADGLRGPMSSPSSAASTLRTSRNSSADPVDIIGEESGSSDEQPVTPVTDLATTVGNIAIVPQSASKKYPIEVDRYSFNPNVEPTWYHVDDVPKDLINEINEIPDWCRNPDHLRLMFESAIIQNTTEDEPEAPIIRIINDVDDDPTPPFEFYYTNRMYHGHGVPPPEYRSLQGCSCIGRCDPQSKTCACVLRQNAIFEKQHNEYRGFVYDNKGRLQIHEYPIFECNDACGCTEDCRNRVVQNGRKCHVNIVKTRDKGWGVFAGKKIPNGTFIGIYAGEILRQEESDMRGVVYNKIGKTYLFDIDFWHIPRAHEDAPPKYCIDAYHVGNFTRFLNHSCDPNCRINAAHINDANIEKALLGIFAVKDINAGEEITFNYFGELDEEEEAQKGEELSYQKCYCGSRNCFGKLFTYHTAA